MVKSLQKILVLILAVLMISVMFAGCKNEGSSNQSADQKNEQGSKEGQKADGEEIQKEPFTYYTRANDKINNLPDNEKVKKYLEEKAGVKMKLYPIPADAYKDKINLMIAAGEEFDAFDFTGFGGFHWTEFLDKKAIMPINDLLDQYGPNVKKHLKEGFEVVSTKDGQIYGIPRKEEFPAGFIPAIRKDWLDKFGMELPETMEDLEKYLEAAISQDPNGNGENDEFGLIPQWGFGGIESNFKAYFCGINGEKYWDEKAGKVMPIYTHPGYKAMLLKMQEWYAKGWLYKEFYTIKSNQIDDLVIADKVSMTAGWYTYTPGKLEELRKNSPKADYVPMPPLKGGSSGVVGYSSNPIYSPQILFSKNSKNAKYFIKYLNWLLADVENYESSRRGIQGEHWEWEDKAALTLKALPKEQSKDKYDGHYGILSVRGLDAFRTEYAVQPTLSDQKKKEFRDYVRSSGAKLIAPFDSHIPYTDKGTKAELLTGDGKTMIEEARMKLILGESTEAEFDKALEKYMEIEGNIRSEVWTRQYKEFTGK